MRKIFYAVLSVLFIFSACAGNSDQSNTASSDQGGEGVATQVINSKTDNMAKTINLTRADFLEKVANIEANPEKWEYLGDKPCIIDFYADWCGPCKMVSPILEELSGEYQGKINIYKVDTESEQELASVFGIRSIPSILFVPKDGQPQMSMGAMPKESFKQAIEEVLLKSKN